MRWSPYKMHRKCEIWLEIEQRWRRYPFSFKTVNMQQVVDSYTIVNPSFMNNANIPPSYPSDQFLLMQGKGCNLFLHRHYFQMSIEQNIEGFNVSESVLKEQSFQQRPDETLWSVKSGSSHMSLSSCKVTRKLNKVRLGISLLWYNSLLLRLL